jgi:penicillin-binding protein 2
MALHLPSLSELRNTEFEIFKFQTRVMVLQGVVLLCFALLGVRLFYLQVIRHEDLLQQAENNRTAILPTVPNRGTIIDRNGVVLANNYSAYTLEITPSRVKDLEATIDSLS